MQTYVSIMRPERSLRFNNDPSNNLTIFFNYSTEAEGIGCFLCSSKNGSNPNCEDPYHPGHSTYAENCMVGKKNHVGRFPASFCVKITGTSSE